MLVLRQSSKDVEESGDGRAELEGVLVVELLG